MTPEQARAVLRVAAQRAMQMAKYLYGIEHEAEAVAVIKEALIVDAASREANAKEGATNGS